MTHKHRVWRVALVSLVLYSALSAADPTQPIEPVPNAGKAEARDEYTYEGKNSAAWIEELKAGNADKASHALKKLGKDAVPPLLALLKADPKQSETVLRILSEMKREREAVKAFTELLKNENWEVRRMAVRALSEFVVTDVAAEQAIKEALKDQDKAVVEAAEDGLKALNARMERRKQGLEKLDQWVAAGKSDEAEALCRELLREFPDDPALRKYAAIVAVVRTERQKRVEVEKRKLEADQEDRLKRDERVDLIEMLVKNASRSLERNDLERAHDLCLKALAIDPKYEPALLLSGKIKAAKAGAGADPKLKLDKKDEF